MTTPTLLRRLPPTRRRRLLLDPAAAHERYVRLPERLLLGALR